MTGDSVRRDPFFSEESGDLGKEAWMGNGVESWNLAKGEEKSSQSWPPVCYLSRCWSEEPKNPSPADLSRAGKWRQCCRLRRTQHEKMQDVKGSRKHGGPGALLCLRV